MRFGKSEFEQRSLNKFFFKSLGKKDIALEYTTLLCENCTSYNSRLLNSYGIITLVFSTFLNSIFGGMTIRIVQSDDGVFILFFIPWKLSYHDVLLENYHNWLLIRFNSVNNPQVATIVIVGPPLSEVRWPNYFHPYVLLNTCNTDRQYCCVP